MSNYERFLSLKKTKITASYFRRDHNKVLAKVSQTITDIRRKKNALLIIDEEKIRPAVDFSGGVMKFQSSPYRTIKQCTEFYSFFFKLKMWAACRCSKKTVKATLYILLRFNTFLWELVCLPCKLTT